MPAIERNALHTAAQPIEQIINEEQQQHQLLQKQQEKQAAPEVVDLLGLGDILFGGANNNDIAKDGHTNGKNILFFIFLFFSTIFGMKK